MFFVKREEGEGKRRENKRRGQQQDARNTGKHLHRTGAWRGQVAAERERIQPTVEAAPEAPSIATVERVRPDPLLEAVAPYVELVQWCGRGRKRETVVAAVHRFSEYFLLSWFFHNASRGFQGGITKFVLAFNKLWR